MVTVAKWLLVEHTLNKINGKQIFLRVSSLTRPCKTITTDYLSVRDLSSHFNQKGKDIRINIDIMREVYVKPVRELINQINASNGLKHKGKCEVKISEDLSLNVSFDEDMSISARASLREYSSDNSENENKISQAGIHCLAKEAFFRFQDTATIEKEYVKIKNVLENDIWWKKQSDDAHQLIGKYIKNNYEELRKYSEENGLPVGYKYAGNSSNNKGLYKMIESHT